MNRLLTLTSGGLFAAMAILPVAAFAQGGTTGAATTVAPVTAPASPADTKAKQPVTKPAPVTTQAVKHDPAPVTKTGTTTPAVQPKTMDQSKS